MLIPNADSVVTILATVVWSWDMNDIEQICQQLDLRLSEVVGSRRTYLWERHPALHFYTSPARVDWVEICVGSAILGESAEVDIDDFERECEVWELEHRNFCTHLVDKLGAARYIGPTRETPSGDVIPDADPFVHGEQVGIWDFPTCQLGICFDTFNDPPMLDIHILIFPRNN